MEAENDNGGDQRMDVEAVLAQMTVEEKAALVAGTDFMYTNPIPRLGVPSLCMSDGPHGLRKQIGSGDNGVSQSEPSTAFPTAAATASSWNPENLRRMGAQFLRRVLESNSPRSMSMSAGKSMPYNFAQGFVELTNGHLIRGAGCFLKKIKVPKLPKEEN